MQLEEIMMVWRRGHKIILMLMERNHHNMSNLGFLKRKIKSFMYIKVLIILENKRYEQDQYFILHTNIELKLVYSRVKIDILHYL